MSQDALTGYESEPREYFEPLPAHLHSQYYHYERLSNELNHELNYYRTAFNTNCSRLIELGCGTSLITNHLADQGFRATGIDLSREMLSFLPKRILNTTAQMDMCELGFRPCFNGALITHNTLNLLIDETRIKQCLAELKRILIPPGILIAHIYTDDTAKDSADDTAGNTAENTVAENTQQKLLQFHIFELPTGEKIVKESITCRFPDRKVLQIEQRYKYRNFSQPRLNRNYRQVLELASFTTEKWLTLLTESGFTPVASTSKFSDRQPDSASTLVVTARAYQ